MDKYKIDMIKDSIAFMITDCVDNMDIDEEQKLEVKTRILI